MAIIKTAGTPNTITFRNTADALFNIVGLKTMYRAKNIKDEKGTSLIDDFAMSQDERDAFNEFLKTAANMVFKTVLKITKGVADAIVVDVVANVDVIIIDNAAYNQNILTYVDNLIKESLIIKIMSEWYKTCGLDSEFQKAEAEFIQSKNELVNGLFELRKPQIS